jgi:hypothetical protein
VEYVLTCVRVDVNRDAVFVALLEGVDLRAQIVVVLPSSPCLLMRISERNRGHV